MNAGGSFEAESDKAECAPVGKGPSFSIQQTHVNAHGFGFVQHVLLLLSDTLNTMLLMGRIETNADT